MSIEKVLPIIMCGLSVGSSIIYACNGDIKRSIYWAAGAVLTAAVTF